MAERLNRTVYLGNGSTMLCMYDSEDQELGPLWTSVFVVSVLLNVFAILGNTAVVIACFLQKNRSPLIIYIHALAISDLCYSMLAPLYIYSYALQYMPQYMINFTLVAKLSHHVTIIASTFSTISSWLVVALTIDRVILTMLPMKASVWSTTRRAIMAVLLIIICCIAFNGVLLYEVFEVPITIFPCHGYWHIAKEVTLEDGSVYTPLRHNVAYKIYTVVSYLLFLYALPTVALVISNALIVLWLKKVTSSDSPVPKSKLAKRKNRELQYSKMIIAVSIVFIVCNLPDILTRVLWKFINPLTVAKIQPIAHLFLMVNVGANFIVYSCFNKQLFHTLIRKLQRCGRKVISDNSSGEQQFSLSKTGVTSARTSYHCEDEHIEMM